MVLGFGRVKEGVSDELGNEPAERDDAKFTFQEFHSGFTRGHRYSAKAVVYIEMWCPQLKEKRPGSWQHPT